MPAGSVPPFYAVVPFSAREIEVARHVARGCSSVEAARLLGISYQTVKNHRYAMILKVGGASMIDVLRALGWLRVP